MPIFNLKRRYVSAFIFVGLLLLVSCASKENPKEVVEKSKPATALADTVEVESSEALDEELEQIVGDFDYVGEASEGIKVAERDGLYGYLDEKGNSITPLAFDDAQAFSEGLGAVKKEGKWGFVNNEGKLLIPHQFEKATSFAEGKAAFRKGFLWGYINKKGEEVIAPTYDFAFPYENGKAKVQLAMEWMFINHDGQCVENCPN